MNGFLYEVIFFDRELLEWALVDILKNMDSSGVGDSISKIEPLTCYSMHAGRFEGEKEIQEALICSLASLASLALGRSFKPGVLRISS